MVSVFRQLLCWFKNFFILLPLMISFWRGIWDLYTYYFSFLPEPLNYWAMVALGSIFILAYFVYPLVHSCIANVEPIKKRILNTTTLYIGSLFLQVYWRGVWGVTDYYLEEFGWKGSMVVFGVCYVILTLSTTSRSLIFPPFIVSLDNRPDTLVPTTLFQVKPNITAKKYALYVMDSLLTHFFIIPTTICTWRCAIYIFSFIYSDPVIRDFICFTLGMVLSILLVIFEFPLVHIAAHLVTTEMSFDDISSRNTVDEILTENVSVEDNLNFEDERNVVSSSLSNDEASHEEPQSLESAYLITSNNKNNNIIQVSSQKQQQYQQQSSSQQHIPYETLLQSPLFSKLEVYKMLVFENIVFFVVFIVEILLWTGSWNLNSRYILENSLLGGWVSHGVGVVGLFLTGSMSFVGACGCFKDNNLLSSFTQQSHNIYLISYFGSVAANSYSNDDD